MNKYRPVNLYDMKNSLRDINELIDDITKGFHIPKRFRNAPFTQQKREQYLKYLTKQSEGLAKRIEALDKPRVVRPVQVKSVPASS